MEAQAVKLAASVSQQNGYQTSTSPVPPVHDKAVEHQMHVTEIPLEIVRSPPRIMDSPQHAYVSPSHAYDSPRISYDDASSVSSFKSDDSQTYGHYGQKTPPGQMTPEHQRYGLQGWIEFLNYLIDLPSAEICSFSSKSLLQQS